MELRVLNYFLTVAREENITKAAALCHITQPTLSRQLMQLEEELGVKLFHRGRHNILLTEEGMFLRRRAQEIIDLTLKTEKELKHGEEQISGEISIGSGETRNMAALSELIASFQKRYPEVGFHIYTAIADDVKERLENGSMDMGILLEPVEISRYHFIRMPYEERYHLLVRRDSALAEKEKIVPADLADVPLIAAERQSVRNQLENWFGDEAGALRIVTTCNLSHTNIAMMVENNVGAAITLEITGSYENLCFRPLEPEIVSGCVLVWKKDRMLSPAVARFLAHIREKINVDRAGNL